MTRTLLAFVLALLVCASWAAAQDDPMMGTWKLNAAKSKLPPERQRNIVRKHEPIPGGIRVSWEGIDSNGQPTRWGFEAKFDGKEYPSTGESSWDTLTLERPDRYTIVGRSKKDGKVAVELRWEVSQDGQTLTRRQQRFSPPEQAGTSIEIFERQ